MRWYQEYKIAAFRDKIHFDTIGCFNATFEILLDLYRNNQLKSQTHTFQQVLLSTIVNIKINIKRENTDGLDFKLGGNFDGSINIDLFVYNDFSNRSIDKLKSRLMGVIKHEIKHLQNYLEGKELEGFDFYVSDPIERIKKATQYMLSETEIDAYIVGIMAESKNSGKNFDDILREDIKANFYGGDKNLENKVKYGGDKDSVVSMENYVFNTIMTNALNRYPLLKKRYVSQK